MRGLTRRSEFLFEKPPSVRRHSLRGDLDMEELLIALNGVGPGGGVSAGRQVRRDRAAVRTGRAKIRRQDVIFQVGGAVPLEHELSSWLERHPGNSKVVALVVIDRAIGITKDEVHNTVVIPVHKVKAHPRAGDNSGDNGGKTVCCGNANGDGGLQNRGGVVVGVPAPINSCVRAANEFFQPIAVPVEHPYHGAWGGVSAAALDLIETQICSTGLDFHGGGKDRRLGGVGVLEEIYITVSGPAQEIVQAVSVPIANVRRCPHVRHFEIVAAHLESHLLSQDWGGVWVWVRVSKEVNVAGSPIPNEQILFAVGVNVAHPGSRRAAPARWE